MKGIVLLSQLYKWGNYGTARKITTLTIFNPGVTVIILFDQKRETGYRYCKWKLSLEIILSIISPTYSIGEDTGQANPWSNKLRDHCMFYSLALSVSHNFLILLPVCIILKLKIKVKFDH